MTNKRATKKNKNKKKERASHEDKNKKGERKMKTLETLVNATLAIEKLRVASEVRQSHLELQGRRDEETDELHKRLVDLEGYVDGRIATLLKSHPAYPWFSRVKGIGKENIGKIIGQVRVRPEIDEEGKELPYANTISGLWKFCGFSVENGKSPRPKKGEKLDYNSQLRSMCWRVSSSLLKAKGKFYDYYLSQKDTYIIRFRNEGRKIVPAAQLPKENGNKVENEKFISEGHVHNMALRKMVKLFLACLWLSWREAESLPLTEPYAIGKLKHDSFISPEMMVDR